jgi:hypothetical protein
MIRLSTLALACLLASAADAQTGGRAGPTAVQAERNSVDLKHGMTPEEVQQLLGKPRRTALKGSGATSAPWQGTLQWTYVWSGAVSSSSERSLSIEFAAKAADQWTVTAWNWSTY